LDDICYAQKLQDTVRFPNAFVESMRAVQMPKRYVPNRDACIENHVHAWLNNPSVQKSLHVKPTEWKQCGGPEYEYYMGSIVPIYEELMRNSRYRIFVYAGDQDTVINFLSTELWIANLKRAVNQLWQPWFYTRSAEAGPQVGGWGTVYDRITFRTVKGAGHMVRKYNLKHKKKSNF
jgi:serine carboxypeptidase-like clade II